ncbi:hypothetical protein [Dokdonella soli]|uniref:hypothetical protein n=1 Tax=Dokdonella soli TaxID=529810 RepID=UPI0031DCE8BA
MSVVVAAISLPTYAQQDLQDSNLPTLQVNKGVVMSSTGGDFVTVATGKQLTKDERLMVTKDSSATVIYKHHCQLAYDKPGVYTIEDECRAGVLPGGAGTVAIVVADVVAAGVIVDNLSNNDSQPISR